MVGTSERETVAFGLALEAGADAELLTIATSPDMRRAGWGRKIFEALNAKAHDRGLERWSSGGCAATIFQRSGSTNHRDSWKSASGKPIIVPGTGWWTHWSCPGRLVLAVDRLTADQHMCPASGWLPASTKEVRVIEQRCVEKVCA